MSSKTKRKRLLKQTGGKCFYCAARLFWKRKGHRKKATLDHYIPKAEGGLNCIENLRAACFECNNKKGRLMPEEWAAETSATSADADQTKTNISLNQSSHK